MRPLDTYSEMYRQNSELGENLLNRMLVRMRQEALATRMMRAGLETLVDGLKADGAAVLDRTEVVHQLGSDCPVLAQVPAAPKTDNRPRLLFNSFRSRFGEPCAVAIWRHPGGAEWTPRDEQVADVAVGVIRLVLDHRAIQREMCRQSRTDPLTGLFNRRAFHEELPRHIANLEWDELPGSLMLANIVGLRQVNEQFGTDLGDEVLIRVGQMLRDAVPPTDLVARLGGDDFAVWMNDTDQFTAAERADELRSKSPRELADVIGSTVPGLGISLGIAARPSGLGFDAEYLIRQAELALREVRAEAPGHWKVARTGNGI